MHHPIDRIAHTTAFVTPVNGSIIKDRSTTHRTMSERSYHGATSPSNVCSWGKYTQNTQLGMWTIKTIN